jgi:hypothetical protein
MRYLIIVILIICGSCATVKKAKTSNASSYTHIDTSSSVHDYVKETIVTEKSTIGIMTKPDSASSNGVYYAMDTSVYTQDEISGSIKLKTTIRPKVINGKIVSYDVNSKATTIPRVIDIPIDKTTKTKETGSDRHKSAITDTQQTKQVSMSKSSFHMSFWTIVSLVGFLVIIALFLFYKYVVK